MTCLSIQSHTRTTYSIYKRSSERWEKPASLCSSKNASSSKITLSTSIILSAQVRWRSSRQQRSALKTYDGPAFRVNYAVFLVSAMSIDVSCQTIQTNSLHSIRFLMSIPYRGTTYLQCRTYKSIPLSHWSRYRATSASTSGTWSALFRRCRCLRTPSWVRIFQNPFG